MNPALTKRLILGSKSCHTLKCKFVYKGLRESRPPGPPGRVSCNLSWTNMHFIFKIYSLCPTLPKHLLVSFPSGLQPLVHSSTHILGKSATLLTLKALATALQLEKEGSSPVGRGRSSGTVEGNQGERRLFPGCVIQSLSWRRAHAT